MRSYTIRCAGCLRSISLVDRERIEYLLDRFSEIAVTVIGDMAIDAYWHIDMKRSELSRETPFYTKPVLRENYSLGAAANTAANLKALGCGQVYPVSAIGTDWRGDIFLDICSDKGIDTSFLVRSGRRVTTAFIKPILTGYTGADGMEDSRFDFENTARPAEEDQKAFLANAEKAVTVCSGTVVCDQVSNGMMSDTAVRALTNLAGKYPDIPFIADSRYRISEYGNMILKPNEIEACRAAGIELRDEESVIKAGRSLAGRAPTVFVTAGKKGVYVFGSEECHQPAYLQEDPVDPVGAGDTCLAVLAAVLSAGGTEREAACMAGLAASVTVKKIHSTGTVTPEEILARHDEVFKGLKC